MLCGCEKNEVRWFVYDSALRAQGYRVAIRKQEGVTYYDMRNAEGEVVISGKGYEVVCESESAFVVFGRFRQHQQLPKRILDYEKSIIAMSISDTSWRIRVLADREYEGEVVCAGSELVFVTDDGVMYVIEWPYAPGVYAIDN